MIARGLYVAGSGPSTGKSAIALGLQRLLVRRVGRLGVFRPVVDPVGGRALVDLLRPAGSDGLPYEASLGVTYADVRADADAALEEVVARFRALAAQTVVPEVELLMAPTVAEAVAACEGDVIAGDPSLLDREASPC